MKKRSTRASLGTRGGSFVEYVMIVGVIALALIVGFKQARVRENRVIAEQARIIKTLDNTSPPDIADFNDPLFGSDSSQPFCTIDGVCFGPGFCFGKGTPVATERGLRPIETIYPGDLVWSRDEATGALDLRPVLQRFVTPGQAVIELGISTPDGGEVLRTTSGHPFWVTGRGWVSAGSLSIDEKLWSPSGAPIHLARAITGEVQDETVYNFDSQNLGGEVHHMPAQDVWVAMGSASPFTPLTAPSIWMEEADHELSGSYDSSNKAEKYRADQLDKVKKGDVCGAVAMDIENIRQEFGSNRSTPAQG